MALRIPVAILLFVVAASACAKPAPKSIEELRAAEREVDLIEVGPIDGGPGFTATLVQYESAGLKVHAMVARPNGAVPEGGWPVVIANHGNHPDPANHGITADGRDHRPGDYYRRVPEIFVARGFLVVLPDYRGHSNSEGFDFTEGMLESAYYTEDVLNLLAAVDQIEGIDSESLFMWGHSMGGEVTLRTLVATNRIRAASLWSSVGGSIWDQAYYYSRYGQTLSPDDSATDKPVITTLRQQIADLDDSFDSESVEPLNYLDDLDTPLIIHHAVNDSGAAFKWSAQLAKELYMRGKTYEFWPVDSSEHLFTGEDMERAADRDAKFFAAHSE